MQQLDIYDLPVRLEDLNTELVPASDPRSTFISIDPNRLWGTACIAGTRVPIKSLFDHLINGVSLDAFLNDFDGVPREKCIEAIATAFERLMDGLPNERAKR